MDTMEMSSHSEEGFIVSNINKVAYLHKLGKHELRIMTLPPDEDGQVHTGYIFPIDCEQLLKEMDKDTAFFLLEKKKQSDSTRARCDLFIKYYPNILATPRDNRGKIGPFYRYENGVYVADDYIEQELIKALGNKYNNRSLSELEDSLKHLIVKPWDQMNPTAATKINCLNGMLDPRTLTLEPWHPKYYSTVQVPVLFVPEARTDFIDKTLGLMFPDEKDRQLFLEFIFTTFIDTNYKTALLLHGPGGNGKSTLMRMIEKYLLGDKNVSNISLAEMEGERKHFICYSLLNKLMNFSGDLALQPITEASVFKAITGGDRIHCEEKYGPSLYVELRIKLAYASNKYPIVLNSDPAFWKRWKVIRNDNVLPEIDRHTIEQEYKKPENMQALFYAIVLAGQRLLEQGRFTEQKNDHIIEFQAASNSVLAWVIDNNFAECSGEDFGVKQVYAYYENWCIDNHISPVRGRRFAVELEDAFILLKWKFRKETTTQEPPGASHIRVIKGIAYTGSKHISPVQIYPSKGYVNG